MYRSVVLTLPEQSVAERPTGAAVRILAGRLEWAGLTVRTQ
jgi:hypothetical protein